MRWAADRVRTYPLFDWLMRRRFWIAVCIVVLILLLFTPQVLITWRFKDKIYTQSDNLPKREYGVVFGASVNSDYSLTDVTRERIEAAILLYRQGAIQKLYVSADNRHNQEADAIARYAMSSGVSVEDIRIDRLGDTTNDTCRHFAQLKAEGVLLTQEFHLPRAMYLCESNGVAPIGLAVNRLGILAQRGDGWVDIYTIRLSRYVRESMLTWAFMVGMYDR